MFVMFLLSHGEDGHVYALNGEKISIQKIMNYFDGKQCPALLGKPKLFFVQACQGGNVFALNLCLILLCNVVQLTVLVYCIEAVQEQIMQYTIVALLYKTKPSQVS